MLLNPHFTTVEPQNYVLPLLGYVIILESL